MLSLGLFSTNLKCIKDAFFEKEFNASIKRIERWLRDGFLWFKRSRHMGLSFKSHVKHLILKVAFWLCVIALVLLQTIFFHLLWFFLLFTRKNLGSLFSIECFIDISFKYWFCTYVPFKTKHNLHLHEYALTYCMSACLIVLHIYCISCYLFLDL